MSEIKIVKTPIRKTGSGYFQKISHWNIDDPSIVTETHVHGDSKEMVEERSVIVQEQIESRNKNKND